jgi:hypothetical protein
MTKARDLANAGTALTTVSATELGYLDGVTSAVQTQVDAKIAKTLTTTTGDIIYASGANTPARLGIGSSAQVLTVSAGVPAWAAPAAGGKVLQVVQATSTTTASTNGSTYTDTTLTASITPSASTSKILVMTYQSFLIIRSTVSDAGAYVNLVRGSTDILTQPGLTIEYGNDNDHKWPVSINYLDSPSTTSSTTYKTQMKTGSTSHTVYAQQANTPSVMILMEIGA